MKLSGQQQVLVSSSPGKNAGTQWTWGTPGPGNRQPSPSTVLLPFPEPDNPDSTVTEPRPINPKNCFLISRKYKLFLIKCRQALGPTRTLSSWACGFDSRWKRVVIRLHLKTKANNHSCISTRTLGLCGLLLLLSALTTHRPCTQPHYEGYSSFTETWSLCGRG